MAIWVNRDGFNSQENHLNLAFGSCQVICLYDSVILLFCLASMRGLTCIPEDISVDGEGRKWECSFADHLLCIPFQLCRMLQVYTLIYSFI